MSTIIEILATDSPRNSRSDLNANFQALNTDKLEAGDIAGKIDIDAIDAATAKTTMADTVKIPVSDTGVLKTLSWAYVKSLLKTYFDTLYSVIGNVFLWKSAWVTSTAYAVNDCVRYDGSGYVCMTAHTSGTFATDLAAGKWALFVQGVGDEAWIDYSDTSTITGWTTFDAKIIKYKKIGKTVILNAVIEGASNSTSTSFTLPSTPKSDDSMIGSAVIVDNNGAKAFGAYYRNASSATIGVYPTLAAGNWTASNTKSIRVQIIYEEA